MMNFEPLKVRAYLQTPVVSDKYLPLDGILFNHFIRDLFGPKVMTRPRQSDVAEYSEKSLPIQKRNMNEPEWYYACSFAVWPDCAKNDTHEYAKRFDTHEAVIYADFKGKRGKVDTQRGQFKNYFVKEYTICSPYVDWYLRGDKEAIEKLLPFCTHIGKKSVQGCGSVLRWEVESTEKDWYKNDDAGKRMRAIPSNKGTAIYGIRPSYWHPRHQARVLLPD
jgi:CRISPR type IV-associated protein Csf3